MPPRRKSAGAPQNCEEGRMDVSDEVARALGEGRGVVALESTLICHGIPRPRNAGGR